MENVFEELRLILGSHSKKLDVVHDEPGYYYLNTKKLDAKGKPIFFGMVKSSAKKVSFHLMPIYCEPSLLDEISPELKARMQGKSCFNFNKQQPELFEELNALTVMCVQSYKTEGKI